MIATFFRAGTIKRSQLMEMEHKDHWNNIYTQKAETALSWFQSYPKISVELVERCHLPYNASIIDIGGGDSHFVDALLDLGYKDITVLDISSVSISRAKAGIGARAGQVQWIISDITLFEPSRQYDLWHDRAAFHFLIDEDHVRKYVNIASKAIKTAAYLVIGTFTKNGPAQCSGLDVVRYSKDILASKFDKVFNQIVCVEQRHISPSNNEQDFIFCSFKNT